MNEKNKLAKKSFYSCLGRLRMTARKRISEDGRQSVSKQFAQ